MLIQECFGTIQQTTYKKNFADKIIYVGNAAGAKNFSAAAVQTVDPTKDDSSYTVQSEDCLTLNIWTRSEKNNLPVMVFIHVGGSVDSLYNGSNFVAIDKNFEDSDYLVIKKNCGVEMDKRKNFCIRRR